MTRRSVLVVGGGIGGLTHTIALRQAGHEVEVGHVAMAAPI